MVYMMEDRHRHCLSRCHALLVDELQVDEILNKLHEKHLFDEEDVQRIQNEGTPPAKSRVLLQILSHKGCDAWETFLEVLADTEGQRHLRDKLVEQSEHAPTGPALVEDTARKYIEDCMRNDFAYEPGGMVTTDELLGYLNTKMRSFPDQPQIILPQIVSIVKVVFPKSTLITHCEGEDTSSQGLFANLSRREHHLSNADPGSFCDGVRSVHRKSASKDEDECSEFSVCTYESSEYAATVATMASESSLDSEEEETHLKMRLGGHASGNVSTEEQNAIHPFTPTSSQEAHASGDNARDMDTWDESTVCEWLKSTGIDDEQILSRVRSEEVNGDILRSMNIDDTKHVWSELSFGKRKAILNKRDHYLSVGELFTGIENQVGIASKVDDDQAHSARENLEFVERESPMGSSLAPVVPTHDSSEVPRLFGTIAGMTFKYKEGALLRDLGGDSDDLLHPIHHFSVMKSTEKQTLFKFVTEVLTFASACLNDRKNGTIHFGVTPGNTEGDLFGRILGITVAGVMTEYAIFLEKAITECFFPDQKDIALACIRPPQFIEVVPHSKTSGKYVIEVDVIPSALFCGDNIFYVKLPKPRKKNRPLEQQKAAVYRLQEGRCVNVSDDLDHFVEYKQKLYKERLQLDERNVKNVPRHNPEMNQKLVHLLCQGEEKFIGDIYPILVINKPDKYMDSYYLKQNFGFLECIPWKAVFDFDAFSTMCDFAEQHLEQVYKIIQTGDFDPRMPENLRNPERLQNLHDDLIGSFHCPWIFSNGHIPSGDHGEETQYKWKTSRKEALKEAVRFFGKEIPQGRAIVVFCLLSKDWEVMLEGAEEFCSAFPNQWMIVSADEFIATPWMEELLRRHCTDGESLESRKVVGMPWCHVNESVQQISQTDKVGECFLPTSSGSFCTISERDKKLLCDLDILSSKECDNSPLTNNKIKLQEKQHESEQAFHRGVEATWWNYWFPNNICPRKQHPKLYTDVNSALSGNSQQAFDGEHVGRVVMFHQPGAGGTTLSKQILWEFRERYRCAIVRNLSESTIGQIMSLRKHKEHKQPRPPLLLIDNLDEEKTNQLWASLEEIAKRTRDPEAPKIICVLLVCLRRYAIPKDANNVHIMVTQNLSPREIKWFSDKQPQLQADCRTKGVNPKLLISFNIMRENFDPDYIKRTVKSYVQEIEDQNERRLLKYIALLNAFDVFFQPVPSSAFDQMMIDWSMQSMKRGRHFSLGSMQRGRGAKSRRWETKLGMSFHILMNETNLPAVVHIHSLRITNHLLAKYVLDELRCNVDGDDMKSVSAVAIEFLECSEIFHAASGMAKTSLIKVVTDVLKRRAKSFLGKPETEFPPLIQEIVDAETVDKALDVLEVGHKLTKDAFVAQQTARLCIHAQKWELALKYAKAATDKQPENSFLWDTHARVHLRQLKHNYSQIIERTEDLLLEDAKKLIHIAFKGIENFRHVQKVSENESHLSTNDAGYFGEIEIIISLLDCLCFLPEFRENRDKLHHFLVQESYVPEGLKCLEDDEGQNLIQKLKGLQDRVKEVLGQLEDKRIQLREDKADEYMKSQFKLALEKLSRLKEDLGEYYGEDAKQVPENLPDTEKCAYRRRRMFRLAGNSLSGVFDLRWEPNGEDSLRTIWCFAKMNIDSGYGMLEDYQNIISAVFSMITIRESYIYERDFNFDNLVNWSRKLYEKRNQREGTYISLEPYLFFVMMNWPRKNTDATHQVTPKILVTALRQWKDAYCKKYPRQQRREKLPYRKKDTTMFFFANGSDIHSIASYEELRGAISQRGDTFWAEPHVLRKLQRFKGMLQGDGSEVKLTHDADPTQCPVLIPTSFPIQRREWWSKPVYFVIGFSWFGPRAFDIQPTDPTDDSDYMAIGSRVSFDIERNRSRSREIRERQENFTNTAFLRRLAYVDDQLRQINELKEMKRSKKRIPEAKVNLLRKEHALLRERQKLIENRQHNINAYMDVHEFV